MEEQRYHVEPQDFEERKSHSSRPKKGRKILGVLLTLILMIISFAGGILASNVVGFQSAGKDLGINNQTISQKLGILEAYVSRYFLYDTDPKELENGVYRGFMAALKDPYATYYSEEEFRQLNDEDSGEYKGIGVTVVKNQTNNFTEIVTVNKGDPAYNAGIKTGDFIVKVNGKETQDMTLTEVVTEIKTSDDPVLLNILRGTEFLDISVDKSTITINSVEYEMKEDQIGFISVSQFIDNTDEQFIAAIDDLEGQGMKGLVVDLRDNGGGMLDTCVNMLSRILPEKDLLVYMTTKNGEREDLNSDSPKTLDVPIVILVNGNTASASEIFTGCLKDYDKATVIGTNTYGKGIVQSVVPLSDGTAIKLTVSQYFTPKGVEIHKKGIKPDIEMEITEEEWKKAVEDPSTDKQLKRALEIAKGKK